MLDCFFAILSPYSLCLQVYIVKQKNNCILYLTEFFRRSPSGQTWNLQRQKLNAINLSFSLGKSFSFFVKTFLLLLFVCQCFWKEREREREREAKTFLATFDLWQFFSLPVFLSFFLYFVCFFCFKWVMSNWRISPLFLSTKCFLSKFAKFLNTFLHINILLITNNQCFTCTWIYTV